MRIAPFSHFARFAIVASCLATCFGCGNSAIKTYRVTGSVTWNGEPVQDGNISFSPADGDGLPQTGKIVDGKYELMATAGAKKVSIHASREGPVDPVMNAPARIPFIPPKYNSQTTLTAEVKPNDENVADFPLME